MALWPILSTSVEETTARVLVSRPRWDLGSDGLLQALWYLCLGLRARLPHSTLYPCTILI